MKKSRVLRVCLFILAVFLLSSCEVVFLKSIAENKKIDKRLLGKWQSADPNDKKGFIEFAKKSKFQIDVIAPDDETGEISKAFTASTVKIGNYYYLNLTPADKDKGNLVARYEIQNNEMTIWLMNSDKIKEALKQNKLKGYSESSGSVVITNDSENIKDFLKSPESDKTFEFFAKLKKSEETSK
jgi:hypothetical protein